MAAHKRALEDASSTPKPKKSKISNEAGRNQQPVTTTEEVDFPRGGGTSFTPLEVKTIRAEAVKEANEELFEVYPNKML
jgi:rRNA biogenesis protein RRP5